MSTLTHLIQELGARELASKEDAAAAHIYDGIPRIFRGGRGAVDGYRRAGEVASLIEADKSSRAPFHGSRCRAMLYPRDVSNQLPPSPRIVV